MSVVCLTMSCIVLLGRKYSIKTSLYNQNVPWKTGLTFPYFLFKMVHSSLVEFKYKDIERFLFLCISFLSRVHLSLETIYLLCN